MAFHLIQGDTVAIDFHLAVLTADIMQEVQLIPSHQVACMVDSSIGKRTVCKYLRREHSIMEITQSHLWAL